MEHFQSILGTVTNLYEFLLSIGLAFFFALALGWLSHFTILTGNVKKNTKWFLILIPTVVLIFSIVKASTALSLGLVGAMSIIRFRTPIKDADELLTLFLAIAIGIGLGAGHIVITSVAFLMIAIAIGFFGHFGGSWPFSGFYLSINNHNPAESTKLDIDAILKILNESGVKFKLKRFSDTTIDKSVVFILAPRGLADLDQLRSSLKNKLATETSIEFLSSDI